MMYSELNHTQNHMLAVLRTELQRGCVPDGFPEVMPMWRVDSGVEMESERDETLALRAAWARLHELDVPAHALLTRLAAGKPPTAAGWPTAVAALNALDAMVDEALSHG